MSSNVRALRASRAILFSKKGGRPIHFLEAIKLEERTVKHGIMVLEAAEILAHHPEAVQEAQEIVQAFFNEPPHPDALPDEPTNPSTPSQAMRRLHFMDAPMVPGQPLAEENTPIGPIKGSEDDDRRTVDEVVRAAEVLAWAVRMNERLVPVVKQAATILRGLAERMGEDKTGAIALRKAGDDLMDAVSAAGTVPGSAGALSKEDELAADAALRKGESVDMAVKFSREWQELHDTGHPLKVTRGRYIAMNLKRTQGPNR